MLYSHAFRSALGPFMDFFYCSLWSNLRSEVKPLGVAQHSVVNGLTSTKDPEELSQNSVATQSVHNWIQKEGKHLTLDTQGFSPAINLTIFLTLSVLYGSSFNITGSHLSIKQPTSISY